MKKSPVSLYGHYIHYNSITKTWNVFNRSEQSIYLNDRSKMKSLMTFNTSEEFIKYINECLKEENND
jgi:hypothetical protein